jgi:hypothetical protein
MSGSCVTSTIVMPLRPELLEQRHDLEAGARVEVAGRLVGEDQARLGHERARDRDALLLAARELVRRVVEAPGEADALERSSAARRRSLPGPRRRSAAARRSRARSCAAAG